MASVKGRRLYDYEALSVALFDELVRRPEGMVMQEILELLDVPQRVGERVITTLRLALGEGDTIAVPVIQQGNRHIYKLSGAFGECQDWLVKRARHKAQLLKTDSASLRALVKATDGRTTDGKAAARMLTSAVRLEEDVAAYLQEAL